MGLGQLGLFGLVLSLRGLVSAGLRWAYVNCAYVGLCQLDLDGLWSTERTWASIFKTDIGAERFLPTQTHMTIPAGTVLPRFLAPRSRAGSRPPQDNPGLKRGRLAEWEIRRQILVFLFMYFRCFFLKLKLLKYQKSIEVVSTKQSSQIDWYN